MMFRRSRTSATETIGGERRGGTVASATREAPIAMDERAAPTQTTLRERERERRAGPVGVRDEGPPAAATAGPAVSPARRQREEFGGLHWGAAFFGWLVATGISTILIAILTAAGTAIGLTELSSSTVSGNAETIGIGGGIALLAVLLIAYYAGGYVAGRMSRFEGGRQGFGVWAIGLIVTLLFAAAGVLFGAEYNVLGGLHLPRIPVQEGTLAAGGAIALAAIVFGTLLAALLGGRVGRRYHLKVDRAGMLGRLERPTQP